MRTRLHNPLIWISLLAVLAAPAAALAGDPAGPAAQSGPRPVVRYASRSDTTAPLYELPPLPPVLGEIFEQRPPKLLPNRQGSSGPSGPDPVAQAPAVGEAAATLNASFEGVNNVDGVLPPDTVGDIGPNHFVQMVNLSFAIYDRSGTRLYGPVTNNTLWQGFGGACETTNNGDPIVLYDHLADRWLMSQFALPRFPRGPFYQCIAISQTGDPTGAWHRYEFLISDTKLNDYPKFGVWPDGYYMAVNQFSCNFITCSWGGQGVVAFERDAMLAGGAARMVYFDLYNTDPNLGGCCRPTSTARRRRRARPTRSSRWTTTPGATRPTSCSCGSSTSTGPARPRRPSPTWSRSAPPPSTRTCAATRATASRSRAAPTSTPSPTA